MNICMYTGLFFLDIIYTELQILEESIFFFLEVLVRHIIQ